MDDRGNSNALLPMPRSVRVFQRTRRSAQTEKKWLKKTKESFDSDVCHLSSIRAPEIPNWSRMRGQGAITPPETEFVPRVRRKDAQKMNTRIGIVYANRRQLNGPLQNTVKVLKISIYLKLKELSLQQVRCNICCTS